MIEVTYRPRGHLLTVKGHAGAGLYGSDPVCAAVSILVYTLAESVQVMEQKHRLTAATVHLASGCAVIAARPRRFSGRALDCTYKTVCHGFRLLAGEYPANLQFTEK